MTGKFGNTAVNSVCLIHNRVQTDPRIAWKIAVEEQCGVGTSMANKSCPKDSFLGLCEEGKIKRIAKGNYTNSEANKRYALDALKILKANPAKANNKTRLWKEVSKIPKAHNNQMDVILALWKNGLFV